MPWVSEEKKKLAKEVGLLSYLLANEPHELVKSKCSRGEYRTVTHGSLVISNDKWFWNREQFGGRSALDFLIKVRGMSFVDAVETVLGIKISEASHDSSSRPTGTAVALPVENIKPPPKKWEFYPPKPQPYSNKAASYLQGRGISPKVINRAIQEGIFFESRYYNPQSPYHKTAVCVFAGKDEHGKVVYAAYRGIGTGMKQDKAGSNKRYNCTLPANNPNSRHLAVFEAPVDLLSHATIQQRNGWDWDGYRLSLGGTSSVALISFLERNPQINRIMLHLDNDAAGVVAARTIKAELSADNRFKHIRVSYNPPHCGAKDYNDFLLRVINMEQEQKQHTKQPCRREAAL